MKNYLDIVVVISPGPDGAYAIRAASDEFGQRNSTIKLPFTLEKLSRAVLNMARQIGTITPKANGSQAAGASDHKSAEDFGVELFNTPFQDQIRDLLVLAQGLAQSSADTGVRIRLSMDLQAPGMAKVASLPWELMCRGRDETPMALSTQTTLVRALDVMGKTEPALFVAPLRIMVVMSNPDATTKLDLEKERKQIEATWGSLLNVKVDFVSPVAAEIRKRLRATKYHVIHYMGHGDFDDDDGVGILLLEKEDKSADRITGDEFARWLMDEPLRLVFLNACKTGTTGERSGPHPFAGVAAALIRQRVPAVVAMQFPISDPAAILFARTFYECILQGAPVDAAVVEGRKELRANKETACEWVLCHE
jgi:CHAT domain